MTEALAALPRDWRDRLANKTLVPVTTGMGGAALFRVIGGGGRDAYLKVGIGAARDLLRAEIERTAWLAAAGIRVPAIVARFIDRDVAAVLMSDLGAHTAEQISSTGWQARVSAIGRAFAHLHALPVAACPFDETLGIRLARAEEAVRSGAVDPEAFDARNRGVSPAALYERLKAGAPTHEDLVVTHGDATLANLILSADGEVGFLDCGHAGKADRYVDLALVIAGLAERFGNHARRSFAQGYGARAWNAGKAGFYLDLYELF